MVWNGDVSLADISFRFEHYCEGLRSLGYDPILVCRKDHWIEGIASAVTVDHGRDLLAVDFWRDLGAESAILVTWLRMSDLLSAISAAGTRIIAISDSDGLVGLRAHPGMTLTRMLVYHRDLRSRLGCIKYWLWRFFTDGLRGAAEDKEYLASVGACDTVVFSSPQAIDHFRRFLAFHHALHLAPRLRVVPYAVPESFCHSPIVLRRPRRLVAIGRWSDPQKDAGLLARGLRILLESDPSVGVDIFGFDAEPAFGALSRRFPNLHLRGPQPPEEIRRSLENAQALVFTSRWETGPHTATEALALGTTLTGAPIPNLEGFCDRGRFGTLASDRSPRALAEAMREELRLWSSGERDPQAVAAFWRARVSPESVCRQLMT